MLIIFEVLYKEIWKKLSIYFIKFINKLRISKKTRTFLIWWKKTQFLYILLKYFDLNELFPCIKDKIELDYNGKKEYN